MLTAARSFADRVEGLARAPTTTCPSPSTSPSSSPASAPSRRRSRPALPPTLVHGDLRLDSARRTADQSGAALDLSPKEFAVLELLLGAGGRRRLAEEIFERVWDESLDPFSQAVKTTISRLRAKLGEPPLIETVAKSGYRVSR